LQFSQASHESQNCLRSEQNQTFYEFIKDEVMNIENRYFVFKEISTKIRKQPKKEK